MNRSSFAQCYKQKRPAFLGYITVSAAQVFLLILDYEIIFTAFETTISA